MSTTIKTTFLILSDTHNTLFPPSTVLPTIDVVLHCGDMTMTGGMTAYRNVLSNMASIPASQKFIIAGNHDLSLDNSWWKTHSRDFRVRNYDETEHEKAVELFKGSEAKAAGVAYLDEGLHDFDLTNGAKLRIYASPYTPEFCDWGFAYERDEDRFNATSTSPSAAQTPIPSFPDVDILMTHGPPKTILDYCPGGHVGCEHLLTAVRRVRPLIHCFGHIHEGYGALIVDWEKEERKELTNQYPEVVDCTGIRNGIETAMVNASVMNVRYRPVNLPWIVEVGLLPQNST